MTERNELINDIQRLKAERNRLLEQIKEAEQWESASWDSYHALVDHINAMEKKQKIARNYWNTSQQDSEPLLPTLSLRGRSFLGTVLT